MFGKRDKTRYGLLVDIGSGSVGFAIVASEPGVKIPTIIYSKREHTSVRQISAVGDSHKALVSLLTDLALTVTKEGFQALHDYAGGTRVTLTEMQVTVAAPWSYSVSRPITYEQTEVFSVTDELIADLGAAAGDEAMSSFQQAGEHIFKEVTETSRCVLDAYANGYRLPTINRQSTTNLTLTHNTTLVYSSLCYALVELNQKLFSSVPLHITSSMVALYYATRQLQPHVYDVCLVDVTDEATEIGIVRNGSLTYCTHTPFGILAIGREIAEDTDRPLSEVTSRLGDILEQRQTKSITPIIDSYQGKVVEVFKETGDALTIPHTVYLLTENHVQTALTPVIAAAAKQASKTDVAIQPAAELLGAAGVDTDFALTMAGRFFHTSPGREHFEYL